MSTLAPMWPKKQQTGESWPADSGLWDGAKSAISTAGRMRRTLGWSFFILSNRNGESARTRSETARSSLSCMVSGCE